MTGTPRCTCQIDAHDFACPIHGEMCLSCGGSGFTSDADGVEHNCYSCETTGRKSMESPMGKPIETPHSPAPTEADICRLEKVAWDANVEHVVIWYRDQIAQLRERVRETEQAWKLEYDRRCRVERAK